MKRRFLAAITCAVLLGLGGCCPNGCFVLHGDAYRKLAYPPPLVNSWVKEGASIGQRQADWEKCGGARGGNFSPNEHQVASEQRFVKEQFIDIHKRLYRELQRCMLKNGYRFTGTCHDNEISRSLPACGAP